MAEEWRDIPEFEGVYQVSNMGRIKSLARGIILSSAPRDPNGYVQKTLSNGLKKKILYVHRLVARAFLKGEGDQVNHKNGVKSDNRCENLEWCDRSHNALHSMYELGSLIKPVIAFNDNERLEFRSIAEAVRAGFKEPKIHRCLNNPHWRHKGYNWVKAEGESR